MLQIDFDYFFLGGFFIFPPYFFFLKYSHTFLCVCLLYILMKLKYVINGKNKIILANSLQDIADYKNISIDSLKYSISHKKLNVNKINVKLKDIATTYPTYEIDMNGVVTIATNNSGSQQKIPYNKQVQKLPNNVAPEHLHEKNVDVK